MAVGPALALCACARACACVCACSPEGSATNAGSFENGAPEGAKSTPEGSKITSWRPPGASWAQVGRQMAPRALRERSWEPPRGPKKLSGARPGAPKGAKTIACWPPGEKGRPKCLRNGAPGGSGGSFWQAFWALRRGSLKRCIFIYFELFFVAFIACCFL